MEYVLTFKNTNFAIKSEQYLLGKKLHVSAVPLPSDISAGCGICLRLSDDEIEIAVSILRENGIEFNLYARKEGDKKYIHSEIKDADHLKK